MNKKKCDKIIEITLPSKKSENWIKYKITFIRSNGNNSRKI